MAMMYKLNGWIVVGDPIVSRYMQEMSNGLLEGFNAIRVNEI